jgi:hypothetical protein
MDEQDRATLNEHTDRILTLSGQNVALELLLRSIVASMAQRHPDPLHWLASTRRQLIQSISVVASPKDPVEATIIDRAETHLDYIFDNIELRFGGQSPK